MPTINKTGAGRPVGAKRAYHETARAARIAAAQVMFGVSKATLRRTPSRVLKARMRKAGG